MTLGALIVPGLLAAGPVQGMVDKTLAFLPNLLAAGVILGLGWLLARIVQRIVTNLLAAVGVDRLSDQGDLGAPRPGLADAGVEHRRFLARATNTGISAIIGPKGEVVVRSRQFETELLQGLITPRAGATPYVRLGDWLAVGLAALLLIGGVLLRRRD